jgi:hypothetical protein
MLQITRPAQRSVSKRATHSSSPSNPRYRKRYNANHHSTFARLPLGEGTHGIFWLEKMMCGFWEFADLCAVMEGHCACGGCRGGGAGVLVLEGCEGMGQVVNRGGE